jgi:hypothetical protein
MDIYDKIIQCFQQSIDRPSIQKFYNYSLEELQDNPDRLKEIADFLTTHQEKYTDFEIITWIDEKTFAPILMLRMYPSEELAKHLKPGIKEKVMIAFQQLQQNQEKK